MGVALVALFMALGGSSYAALRVGSAQIKNNSVRTQDLRNNDIRGKDIRNSTITGADVGSNRLTGADIKESTLGVVPNASQAVNATQATQATIAGKAFQTFKDAELSLPTTGGSSTVLSLNVPAGTYLIFGKGYVNNDGAASARTHCRTTAGTDVDEQFVGTSENNRNDDVTPWTNSLVHTFASNGTITLACDANAQQLAVGDRKIQALQVREISNVAAP
jgi:hypothetical protein